MFDNNLYINFLFMKQNKYTLKKISQRFDILIFKF